MDTSDLKIKTIPDLSKKDILKLRKEDYINRWTMGSDYNYVVLSIPKTYYKNNAYLVTKQAEVKRSMEQLKEIIENKGYQVEIETLRIDYPFTFIRPGIETFESWDNIHRLLNLCGVKYGLNDKEYLSSKGKEGFCIADNFFNHKIKISIYNQALKLREKGKFSEYETTIKKFNDLEQRTRIEVSNRLRIKGAKLSLKNIKTKAYEVLEEIYFNNLDLVLNEKIEELTNNLNKAREKEKFRIDKFIERNLKNIYDFEILKRAIKLSYENYHTIKSTITKSKKIILEIEEETGVFYVGNIKRVKELKKQLKKEKRSPTA